MALALIIAGAFIAFISFVGAVVNLTNSGFGDNTLKRHGFAMIGTLFGGILLVAGFILGGYNILQQFLAQ